MNTNLQTPNRPIGSAIDIVDDSPNIAGQLDSFPPNAQPFTSSFHSLDNIATRPHLHTSTRAQDAIALETNAHDDSNDGIPLLPPTDQPFTSSGYDGQAQDSMTPAFAGQLQGMKLVPDPPDLEYWRHRLFHIDEMVTLTEDEYVNYSP